MGKEIKTTTGALSKSAGFPGADKITPNMASGSPSYILEAVKPVRIQRSRQHKQKSPNGLPIQYVGRPGRFGNPFRLVGDLIFTNEVRYFSHPVGQRGYTDHGFDAKDVYNLFRDILFDLNSHPEVEQCVKDKIKLMRDTIRDLQGKNLSCWCREGEACHADALLELASSYDK